MFLTWFLQPKKPQKEALSSKVFKPDEDDIYFMVFLLHDAYEISTPVSTVELSKHHPKYAPLEVEVKLITLEKNGYIERVNRKNAGMGLWQLLPKGVEFMFANGHQLNDLIEEQRQA